MNDTSFKLSYIIIDTCYEPSPNTYDILIVVFIFFVTILSSSMFYIKYAFNYCLLCFTSPLVLRLACTCCKPIKHVSCSVNVLNGLFSLSHGKITGNIDNF